MEAQKLFRILSSFAVLLPVTIGLIHFRKATRIQRLLLFFLLYGFCTDMLCWYFFAHDNATVAHFLFNIYSLVEFIFYFYFLNSIGTFALIRKAQPFIFILFISAWIYIYFGKDTGGVTISGIFNASYEVLFVIMSAYALLKFVEQRERISEIPEFWFTAAIFFYCINVFFIFQLLSSSLVQKIWFIQNIINIITSFFLSVGFIMIGKRSRMLLQEAELGNDQQRSG